MTVRRHEVPQSVLSDLLFDEPSVGRCLVAPDGSVLRVNAEWLRSTGFALDDVLGADIVDLFPETRELALSLHARARAGHRVDVPRHSQRVQGRDTRWEGSIAPVPMEGGTGLLITAREVTAETRDALRREHTAAESARQEEEQKYRSLFESSIDAVYVTRHDGAIVDANPAACRLHGMTVDEIRARGRAGLLVADERLAAALAERATHGFARAELTMVRKDGTTFPAEVESVVVDAGRRDWTAFVIARDISARREREAALREAIRRFERQVRLFEGIASTTPDFVYLFDLRGRFLYANRRLLDVWGMRLADAVGKTCRELGYEQWHHDMHMREIAQVIATKQPIKGEVPFKAPRTGIFGVYEYIFTPVIGPDGEVETIAGTTRDVTERKGAEEALRENQARLEHERARLQAVIDTIPVGFFLVERGGKVVVTNDEAKRMWRGSAALEEIADSDRYVGYWPETGERLKAEEWPAAQALLHGRSTKGVTVEIERFDGTRGTILFSGAPIQDGAGNVTGAVVAAQDISELHAAHARLEEADRRKTEFLATLSHELRNPLAPIRNSVYLLERAPSDSEQATRAREVLRRQTEHLTRLVDDLLDVTRISHGKIPLERGRVDLREIVRKTTDDLHSVFTQAGIHLRVDHVTAGPTWVEADATRMAQVLTNLLNNSAKFTASGGTVRVSVAARGGQAELCVVDDGIGMDPRQIEHMFEPFAQAEQSLARTQGGLGLGLALVRSIVELHGGTVAARSEGIGRGAKFLVRLPLAGAPGEPERPRPRHAGTTPRTILVIEDNVDGAQSLADVLELHGHRVRVARDGRSGIALARELQPDVILCDIGLPDVDGYDVARTLRREGRIGATRLVALSGYVQPEDRQRARDAGFDAHLAKPVEFDELMTAVAVGT
jgi:PAS domain S-box-containing protein